MMPFWGGMILVFAGMMYGIAFERRYGGIDRITTPIIAGVREIFGQLIKHLKKPREKVIAKMANRLMFALLALIFGSMTILGIFCGVNVL